MVKCAVPGCRNYSEKRLKGLVKFYTFPSDKKVQEEWINACGGKNANINPKVARICSQHFTESDFTVKDILLKTPISRRRLKEGAVPSINVETSARNSARKRREKKRILKELVNEALASYEESKAEELKGQDTPQANSKITSKKRLRKGRTSGEQTEEVNNSKAVQTEIDIECAREFHIMNLEKALRSEKSKNRMLTKKLEEYEKERIGFEKIFTPGQLRKLTNPGKNIIWSDADMSSAISLYSAGLRSYRLMLRRGFPLPSPSALRKWAAQLKLEPGIMENVLILLKDVDYSTEERLCVLSFDEMKLKSSSENDKEDDETVKPSTRAQVVMISGLVRNWKQVIYYSFDDAITAQILGYIIERLSDISFHVVAVASNMSPKSLALWKDLSISPENPYIFSSSMQKIFFFVDTPYLIKSIRDHFIDTGFIIDGKLINCDAIKDVLLLEKSDFHINFKVTQQHLSVSQEVRENVKYATQLFSRSVSEVVKTYAQLGEIKSENALECSDFLEIVNDWFDLFNSSCISEDSSETMQPYGLALDVQNTTLLDMTTIMQKLRAPNKKSLLPFKKGILLNNSSLPQLLDYLNSTYNIACILTKRLNQGELKQVFDVIRSNTRPGAYPTSFEFKYRLRSYILGNL